MPSSKKLMYEPKSNNTLIRLGERYLESVPKDQGGLVVSVPDRCSVARVHSQASNALRPLAGKRHFVSTRKQATLRIHSKASDTADQSKRRLHTFL